MKQIFTRYIAVYMAAVFALSFAGCGQQTGNNANAEAGQNSADGKEANMDGNGVIFSQSGGLYEQAFSLELSTNIANGVVRYTLDGSDPTSESAPYTEGITISDRTGEDNLLSAITISGNRGGFGGGFADGDRPTGDMPGGGLPDGWMTPPSTAGEWRPQSGDDIPQRPNMDNADRIGGPGGGGASAPPAENVFKGTVVKAAVFSENGEILSDISVQSYFIGEDIFTRYGDLPIVSIVTDAENFFDEESGIYANSNQSGSDWERPVYFEMFEPDGTSAISQDMGVRINGGSTRSLAQKALRFYAKKDYDEDNPTIEYELFDGLTKSYSDDPLTTFKRIILRSGGNDNSGSLFRDALMQSLVSDLNVDTQASRPCVAFLNGEFWGIYNIRERYDDHYFANHYDIDTANVTVLEISHTGKTPEINEGDESDLEFYNEMWNFFNDNSMTTEANYRKAQEYLDIDNFIDYYIANIYSGNTDWPANNNLFWRYKTENGGYDATAEWYKDGRFRWVVKDMDFGFGQMTAQTNDTLAHATSESSSRMGGGRDRDNAQNQTDGNRNGGGGGFTSAESTLMFRKLLENDEFKAKFINRFCDVMNTNYDPDTVITSINSMKAEIESAIPEQSNRYSNSVSGIDSWEASIDKMILFARERAGYVWDFLQSGFSLQDTVTVTLNTDGAGYIRINDTDITTGTKGVRDAASWNGSYFAGTTQTFTAVPPEGRKFAKFIVTDNASGQTTEYTESEIAVILGSSGTVVQAVFE